MGVLVKNGKSYTGTGDLLIQPVIYSDDERCIGVWRDGKPLYRKTISGRTPSSSYDYFGDEIENFEHCYYYEGVIIPDNANSSVNSIFYNRPDNNNAEYYIVIESTGKVFIRTYSSKASTFYVTIFYTKTTDTAGTAAWVPTGATPIHYSLNEQVIGTWIDGKPLYQKTIHVGALTKDTNWHEVPHGISNFKKLVDIKGVCDNDNTPTESYPISGYRPNMTNGFIFSASVSSIFYMNNWNNIIDCYVTIQYTKTTD